MERMNLRRTFLLGLLLVGTVSSSCNQDDGDAPQAAEAAPGTGQQAEPMDESIGDDRIALAVQDFLAVDPPLFAGDEQVRVDEGVVTIQGKSPSLLAKDRALQIVGATRGVRAVVDLVEVEPVTRTDKEILADERSALDASLLESPGDLRLKIQDGVVTLEGKVDSAGEREIALQAARGVRGVLQVRDELTVDPPEWRTDEDIREDVEQSIAQHPYVDARDIQVHVSGGKVYLSGKVGTMAERSLLTGEAYVPGAVNVFDRDLAVDPELSDPMRRHTQVGEFDASQLAGAASKALELDPRIISPGLRVRISGSEAILDGVVTSVAEERAAVEDVGLTVGVREVADLLEVAPARVVDDAELVHRVQDAMERDPFLHGRNMAVEVLDGVVTLSGQVRSAYERTHALELVSGLAGVVRILDEMQMDPSIAPPSREELVERVENALYWSPFVDHSRLQVQADDSGMVELRGVVDSYQQLELVNDMAMAAGAAGVRTSVCVEGWDEVIQHCLPEP